MSANVRPCVCRRIGLKGVSTYSLAMRSPSGLGTVSVTSPTALLGDSFEERFLVVSMMMVLVASPFCTRVVELVVVTTGVLLRKLLDEESGARGMVSGVKLGRAVVSGSRGGGSGRV